MRDPSLAVRLRVTISWPRRQVIITIEITSATTSGSHAPCSTLAMLAAKNDTSTVKNRTTIGTSLRFGVPQRQPGDGREEHRVEDERSGDRDPVDVSELVGGLENQRQRDHPDTKPPVDNRNVDLPLDL